MHQYTGEFKVVKDLLPMANQEKLFYVLRDGEEVDGSGPIDRATAEADAIKAATDYPDVIIQIVKVVAKVHRTKPQVIWSAD